MNKVIGTYMIPDPISVSNDVNLKSIFQIMELEKVSHLIVTKDTGQISGVISKQDLLTKMKELSSNSSGKTYTALNMENLTASDIMTSRPIVVKKDDALEYGVELLLQKQFHCLPVIEGEKAIGIVTAFDLLKGYYQEFG